MSEQSNEGFLVVGVSEESKVMDGEVVVSHQPSQTSIVGVTTSKYESELLVGQDYMHLLTRNSLNPLLNPMSRLDGEDGSSSYAISGYTWHIVPLKLNSLVNFTL